MALKSVHDCGIGHNKMHPGNIIITPPVQRLKDPDPNNIASDFSAVIVDFRCFNVLDERRSEMRNEQTKQMDRNRIGAYLGGCCDSHYDIVVAAAKEASDNAEFDD